MRSPLLPRVADAAPQRAEAAALPAQITQLTSQARTAEDEETRARAAADAAHTEITARRTSLKSRREERAHLGDLPAAAATTPLDAAREQREIANAAYRAETSGSALAAQLDEATRIVPGPTAESTV